MKDRKQQELQKLSELPDDQIDTSDIPEITGFSGAMRGRFYRPVKKQVTLRIDFFQSFLIEYRHHSSVQLKDSFCLQFLQRTRYTFSGCSHQPG